MKNIQYVPLMISSSVLAYRVVFLSPIHAAVVGAYSLYYYRNDIKVAVQEAAVAVVKYAGSAVTATLGLFGALALLGGLLSMFSKPSRQPQVVSEDLVKRSQAIKAELKERAEDVRIAVEPEVVKPEPVKEVVKPKVVMAPAKPIRCKL